MVVIIGAGAVGTVLAGMLGAAGRQVCLVCREPELEGLTTAAEVILDRVTGGPPVIAPKPLFTTRFDPGKLPAAPQAVFICVKYPDLGSVLDALPPLPPELVLVSTLNGVGAARRIRERFPQQPVVATSVLFHAQLLEPLHARITTRPQLLMPFDHDRLVRVFDGTGIRLLRAHGEAPMWGKLLYNLGNALGAATHTSLQDLLTHPVLRGIYAGLMQEGAAVLHAAGIEHHPPTPLPLRAWLPVLRHGGPLPWWLARLRSGLSAGAYPSMVSDIEHGRATEIDILNGEIASLARSHNVPAPLNTAMVQLIHDIEAGRQRAPMTPQEVDAVLRGC